MTALLQNLPDDLCEQPGISGHWAFAPPTAAKRRSTVIGCEFGSNDRLALQATSAPDSLLTDDYFMSHVGCLMTNLPPRINYQRSAMVE